MAGRVGAGHPTMELRVSVSVPAGSLSVPGGTRTRWSPCSPPGKLLWVPPTQRTEPEFGVDPQQGVSGVGDLWLWMMVPRLSHTQEPGSAWLSGGWTSSCLIRLGDWGRGGVIE